MKLIILLSLSLRVINPLQAETLSSTRIKTSVEVSRVAELVKLTTTPDIQINLIVKDNGGTTDVSPTQQLFFTLYSKGELFNTDATFDLGLIYDFKSAKKISNGVFEVFIGGVDDETSMPSNKLLIIDAQRALKEISSVRCREHVCPESDKFKTTIMITKKII